MNVDSIRRTVVRLLVITFLAGPLGCGGSSSSDLEDLENVILFFGTGGLGGLGGTAPATGTGGSSRTFPPGYFTISAEPAGAGEVRLTWTSSDRADQYILKRSTSPGGPYVKVAEGLTGLSTVDGSLANGTTYFYRMQSTNSGGSSADTNEAAATARDPLASPPAVIDTLSATTSLGQVSLSWTAPAGAMTYTVLRSTVSGSGFATLAVGVSSPSYQDSQVTRGGTYFYLVVPVNTGGESARSNEASAAVAPAVPTAIAAHGGNGVVRLSWERPAGATSFSVARSSSSAGPFSLLAAGMDALSYTDPGLVNGTVYFYVIRAINGASESEASRPVWAMPVRIVSLAAGSDHGMGLDDQGNVWTWGSNEYGQLGDGSRANRSVPRLVSEVSGVVAIAAGGSHSLALRNDGTVFAWGGSTYGQMGYIGADTLRPHLMSGLTGVTAIAAGFSHSLALRGDGTVLAWGSSSWGALGAGNSGPGVARVANLTGVRAIAAGCSFSLALREDGTVWTWGRNDYGMLGDGTTLDNPIPAAVLELSGAVSIGAGWFHGMAVKNDGTVWTWGSNMIGQLGNGSLIDSSLPVQATGLSEVAGVAGGAFHSLALLADGTAKAWGSGGGGELGNGTTGRSTLPVLVTGLSGITSIAAGNKFSFGLQVDGSPWAWGSNLQGRLGTGNLEGSTSPIPIRFP